MSFQTTLQSAYVQFVGHNGIVDIGADKVNGVVSIILYANGDIAKAAALVPKTIDGVPIYVADFNTLPPRPKVAFGALDPRRK